MSIDYSQIVSTSHQVLTVAKHQVIVLKYHYEQTVIIASIPHAFSNAMMQSLELSSLYLLNHSKGQTQHQSRTAVKSMHYGYWNLYSPEGKVFMTKNTKEAGMQMNDWIQKNDQVLAYVECMFKQLFPKQHEEALDTPTKYRPFKMWTTIAINVNTNTGMSLHKDKRDWQSGYCAVIPFGTYQGGEVYFPELGVTIMQMNTGVLFFKSRQLLHGVKPFIGNRGSLVLFNCDSTMKMFL